MVLSELEPDLSVLVAQPSDRGHRRGTLLAEGRREATRNGVPARFRWLLMRDRRGGLETRVEFVRAAASSPPVMGDLVEAAEVVGLFLEVGNLVPIGNVPQRADDGKEGGLPRAVLADEQGQRGEARGLLFPEAAVVPERDFVHGNRPWRDLVARRVAPAWRSAIGPRPYAAACLLCRSSNSGTGARRVEYTYRQG